MDSVVTTPPSLLPPDVQYALGSLTPTLGEGAWIAPSADVIGEVSVGDRASLWFQVVARGDSALISVGDGSNIQDGSILHADTGVPLQIGRDCTIGHQVMLHGCTIGDNSLIGIQSVILNRAVIGANTLVAAGSLVPEGKTFPDGVMLMGRPAKVVRSLSDAEITMITLSAQHYQQNAVRFARELAPR